MKKIMIVTNDSGGLYRFRKMLIEYLIKKNWEIVVLTPFDSNIKELKALGLKLYETPIERRGVNVFADIRLYKFYKKQIKNICPNLVITYTIKPNIYCGFACRVLKIKYDVNITGLGTAFQKNNWLKLLVLFMYKISLKNANTIFFENEENKNIFIENKIIKENKACVLMGAGVDTKYFSYLEYPTEQQKVNFLFIGRVMKEKGIDELFLAMKKLKNEGENVFLDILGALEEDYKDKIKKYENEGWLHFHGVVNDVRPFIKRSHCFVLPSWHEGMANTNLECASSGRPIITSNISGCKEAVIANITGFLCECKNSNSLYAEMKKFVEISNEDKKNMGIIGRKHMKEHFEKKQVVKETLKQLF